MAPEFLLRSDKHGLTSASWWWRRVMREALAAERRAWTEERIAQETRNAAALSVRSNDCGLDERVRLEARRHRMPSLRSDGHGPKQRTAARGTMPMPWSEQPSVRKEASIDRLELEDARLEGYL